MRLWPALHSADPLFGGRRACHGAIPQTRRRVDSHQRRGQRSRLSGRAGTHLGGLVLRLAATSALPDGEAPQGRAPDRHRRAAVKKKDQQYVAVIVDHDNQRVLDVLENRDKATVYAYLEQGRKGGLLRHVEEVTIDMWSAYEGAV